MAHLVTFVMAAAALLLLPVDSWILPTTSKRCISSSSLYAYLDDDNASSPVNKRQSPPKQEDYTGAGTLGDIMSSSTDNFDGLVTTDGGLLYEKYGITSPLDRMALTGMYESSSVFLICAVACFGPCHTSHRRTYFSPCTSHHIQTNMSIANGNLQRLFSSYYDAPVHVVVDTCDQTSRNTWNRVVHLTVFNEKICTATSRITVHNDDCCKLVESQQVGLGQLFRYLDKLPSFSLLDAGYSTSNSGLWRIYELDCAELTCHIEEKFAPDMWNISPQDNVENR